MRKLETNWLIFCGFLALSFLSLILVFEQRQLFNDGSYWLYDIINQQSWHKEANLVRFTTYLIQTPAVLLSKTTRNVWLIDFAFCFSYGFYGIISLLILKHLDKKSNFQLFNIFLFITLICIVPSWNFAVNISNESIILSFFLFYSLLNFEKRKILFFLSSLALCFSYEISIIFHFLSIYILFREKKLKIHLLFFILFFIGIYIYFNYKNNIIQGHSNNFLFSVQKIQDHPFYIFSILFTLLLPLYFFSKEPFYFQVIKIVCFYLTFYALKELFLLKNNVFLASSYDNRIWGIFLCFIILFLAYEFLRRDPCMTNKAFVFASSFMLLIAFSIEFKSIFYFKDLIMSLDQFLLNKTGCYSLNELEFRKLEKDKFIPRWSAPYLSIARQKTIRPKSIFFPPMTDKNNIEAKNEFCKIKNDHGRYLEFINENEPHFVSIKQNYDFSKIFSH